MSLRQSATERGVFSFKLSDAVLGASKIAEPRRGSRRQRTKSGKGLIEELVGARAAEAKGVSDLGDRGGIVAQNEGGNEAEGGMGLGEEGGGSVERHLGTPPASEILADGWRRGSTPTPTGRPRCPTISSRRQAASRTDPPTATRWC